MMRNSLCLMIFFFALMACGDDGHVMEFGQHGWIVRANRGSEFSLMPRNTVDSLLWKNGEESIWEDRKHDQNLVMVSTVAGSHLESELVSDPRTVLFKPSDFQRPGRFLLSIANTEQIDQLASRAHAESHSCGNLEVLNLNGPFPFADLSSLYPVIIPERFKSDAVSALIKETNKSKIEAGITTLESLGTRMHSTTTGATVATKVLSMFNAAQGSTGYKFTTEDVEQPLSDQKSLIVRIKGTKYPDEVVIIGAHMDSINRDSSNYANAPGADDDASGIATQVEIFRVLAASGAEFERTVEFHAYAAEEVGLVGSRSIASDYAKRSAKVTAMLQIDMNAYHQNPNSETIYLVSTDTSSALTRSLKTLLTTYLDGDYTEKTLTAGTSDHKAWTSAGFAAVFPFEDPEAYNMVLHTPKDTSSNANNTNLSNRFAKLGVAFLAHHAGLEEAVKDAASYSLAGDLGDLSDDLKVAITPDETNTSLQNWAIASDERVKRVEVCSVPSKDAASCEGELVVLKALTDAKNRSRHTSKEAESIGGKYRLFGYDEDDKLIAARQITAEK